MATSRSDVQVNPQKVFVAKALVFASWLQGSGFGKEQRPLKAIVGVFKPKSPPNTALQPTRLYIELSRGCVTRLAGASQSASNGTGARLSAPVLCSKVCITRR